MSIWSGRRDTFTKNSVSKRYYVYAIKLNEYSLPIYIGKGSLRRCVNHHTSPGNSAMGKVLKKNPLYFVEILSESDNEDVIYQMEMSFISKFGLKDSGGLLLNFSSGGRNTARGYFSSSKNRSEYALRQSNIRGKRIFIEGFIFPSIRLAARTLNTDRNHIKYLIKKGRAFLIEGDIQAKNDFYYSWLSSEIDKYITSVNRSSKQVTTNKAVSVDGKIYSSTVEAGRELGVTPGAIRNRIIRGNQKNTYYLEVS